MSMYVSFYIREKDSFIPVGTYSRSNAIFRIMQTEVPFEKIGAITKDDIFRYSFEAEKAIKEYREKIEKEESLKKEIITYNNSVSEKREAIEEIDEYINEIKEEIDDLTHASYYFYFLQDIIEEIEYGEQGEADIKKRIYAGIEVFNPTIEDVVEKN